MESLERLSFLRSKSFSKKCYLLLGDNTRGAKLSKLFHLTPFIVD